ncbi:MAG: thioredoxin family protein [Candidatus Aminicenantes bacterium]|nr:thioredoxin family protein [Candidatus Aminicenantes bacterium]
MTIRDMMKTILNKPEELPGADPCVLVQSPVMLEEAIRSRDRLMVLFYASWCPFSQAFLPTYRKHAAAGEPCYVRILVDEGDALTEKYSIEVYPTVLYFEKGKVVNRLDGIYHRGLSKGQLKDFARRCAVR